MSHEAGLWRSRVVPRMEEKVSRTTWQRELYGTKGAPKTEEKDRKEGSAPSEEKQSEVIIGEGKKRMYPAGKPFRLEERGLSKHHRPKSTADGAYLCWGFSSHGGCQSTNDNCSKGKHELMSANGLHSSILMQLARRGGHKSGRRIAPEQVDGYLQAIRDNSTQEEILKKKKPWPPEIEDGKKVWKPKLRASGASTTSVRPLVESDVVVYPFGSGKRLPNEEASQLAINRATTLQSDLEIPASPSHRQERSLLRKIQYRGMCRSRVNW